MSSLQHNGWVEIRVRGACKTRSGTHDTRASSSGEPIYIKLALTEAQFASFITTSNQGDGTPCTISVLNGKKVEDCPEDEQLIQFRQELHNDASRVTRTTRKALTELRKITPLEGTIRKKELREKLERVQGLLATAVQDVDLNLPFLVQTFEEYMDGVFHDAVAQFEGHVKTRSEQLGFEALRDGPKALGGKG